MSAQKNIKIVLLLLMCGFALVQSGCKKDKNEGKPAINRIRAVSPAPNDSVLSKAGPGQTIVIQGSNLATTNQVWFNGYAASYNSALFSDENVVVTIPADMPFASLDQSKLNTIRLVTSYGEVTFNFPIEPPAPVIAAMSNEMALAGEKVAIVGNNFFFIDKVIFPGNIEVTTNIVTNASGTALELTVPAGITTGGPIRVVNRYGTGVSVLLFNDMVTGMLNNYDNVNTFSWGSPVKDDATLFPGNRNKYSHLKQDNVAANNWDWWNGNRGVITNQVDWVPAANVNDPAGNWAMKFEVYVKESWSTGCLYIGPPPNDDWQFLYRFEPWKTSPDFKSGGWRTVIIPLNMFRKKDANGTNGAGPAANTVADIVGSINEVVKFMFVNDTGTPLPKLDMAVDNIRVVKLL